jgi:hypothetical protein
MVSERDLAMVVKQPILIGGLGLSVALGLLQVTHVNIIDSSTLLSVLALGTGVWWWRRRDRPPSSPAPLPPVVDRQRVESEISRLQLLIQTLEQEAAALPSPRRNAPYPSTTSNNARLFWLT